MGVIRKGTFTIKGEEEDGIVALDVVSALETPVSDESGGSSSRSAIELGSIFITY